MIRLIVLLAVAMFGVRVMSASDIDRVSIIVLGTIDSGTWSGSTATASIRVERVLKGEVVTGQVLKVSAGLQSLNVPRNLAGISGIWFLEKSSQNPDWRLTPLVSNHRPIPFEGLSLHVASNADLDLNHVFKPGYSAQDDITAAVVFTLNQVAIQSAPLKYLHLEILVEMLAFPKSPVVIAGYMSLADSRNPDIRNMAIAGLLRSNRFDYLQRLLLLPELLPNTLSEVHLVSALSSVCDRDATTVSVLGLIATGSHVNPRIRLGAAVALARIHDAATLPFLNSALADTNPAVQKIGVEGFSLFAENLPVKSPESIVTGSWLKPPTSAPFKTVITDRYVRVHPAQDSELPELVVFWRQWYQFNRSTIERTQ